MSVTFSELCIDSGDPGSLAAFWAEALGWNLGEVDDDGAEVLNPSGFPPTLLFVPVPESKTVKNRLHIDISPEPGRQLTEVQRLLDLGARHVDVGQGQQSWVVLADPEGNEFCVLGGVDPDDEDEDEVEDYLEE